MKKDDAIIHDVTIVDYGGDTLFVQVNVQLKTTVDNIEIDIIID